MNRAQFSRRGMTFSLFLLSFLLSGYLVAGLEWSLYASVFGGKSYLSTATLLILFSFSLGFLFYFPFVGIISFLRSHRHLWSFLSGDRRRRDFFFLWFLSMAFMPYPIFWILGRLTSRMTDSQLLLKFSSSAAILAVAAASVGSALLAWGLVLLLGRWRLLWRGNFLFFYLLAFPLPIFFIPFWAIYRDPEPFVPAARLLLFVLLLALVPLLLFSLGKLSELFQRVFAYLLVFTSLLLFVGSAGGWLFQVEGVLASPFSSLIYKVTKRLVDFDKDGYIALFERRDCDEWNAKIHPMATDIPGNGIDENCDGRDASKTVFRQRKMVLFPTNVVEQAHSFKHSEKYNIILILLDTLRSDHVHSNGYKRKTTPVLDRLAKEGLVFSNAISQAPATGFSVPSILTGRYPDFMEWRRPRWSSEHALGRKNLLISDWLKRHGYHTEAIVSPWIQKNITGFAHHFDHQVPLYPHHEWRRFVRDSSKISITKAIEFFEHYRFQRPFFLFLHMEEPHLPYVNHPAPGKIFGWRDIDRYDSDVYWADLWIGFLLGYMEQKAWAKKTIFIVVADHGEEFLEHGRHHHGHQIYQESIRVPIFIKAPHLKHKRVRRRVALVDLFPTILDLTGVPYPATKLHGVSLLKSAFASVPQRPLFSALIDRERRPTNRAKAILFGRYKLIFNLTHNKWEFFDLLRDPKEKHPLPFPPKSASRPVKSSSAFSSFQKMKALLRQFLQISHPSLKRY